MKVMVTGAAGYIGGETVLKLVDAGHEVLGVDIRRPADYLENIPGTWWSVNDFASEVGLSAIEMFTPEAIIHCAGTSLVGPSVLNPRLYYDNNFVKTKILLDHLIDKQFTNIRFIFSSSAAVYGEPIMTPCDEVDPTLPVSPYGESKLMIEWMLSSYARSYDIDYVAFRYFNACGADSQGRHGQLPGATHIIARVLEAIKNDQDFTLYGDHYPTPDGTCIRDYIHVEDLAQAHIRALKKDIVPGSYNLGNTKGHSNLEVVQAASRITGKDVGLLHGQPRDGDPAQLTAVADKFQKLSGWQPQFGLDSMIQHAWTWYNK
jgi:UDP-glucose 4-epimerase